MKAYKRIMMLLLFVVAAIGSYAQYRDAEWRFYQKGWSNYSAYYGEQITKVVFTDTNYDVYVSSTKGIKDDGHWCMTVSGYGALSITTTKIGVVPADYSNELIESMFLEGTLTDLHEASNESYNIAEFIVEDGAYKSVIFGFDAQGTYKGFSVGYEQQVFTSTVDGNQLLITPVENNYNANNWGYGSLMHIRDVMGEEYVVEESGYDWYGPWSQNYYLGSTYAYQQVVWKTLDNAIAGVEAQIDMLQKRSQIAEVNKASFGTAYALRSMLYLDAARMYEFLENDGVGSINEAGNNVLGLTYPIGVSVPYQTEVPQRATREEMATYILADLDKAEVLLNGVTQQSKLHASLAVVYGLKARLYLWTEDYEQAKAYADKAISTGNHTPLNQAEWLDITNGFNNSNVSSWMWAMTYPEESDVVQNGLHNWTSWCSNEYTDGYAAIGPRSMIGKAIYNRISDTDFRKLSFIAPYGSPLYGQEPYLYGGGYEYMPDYASLKFRPGQGNVDDYQIACAVDVPLMRIEEMYLIRCEAEAQLGNVETAKAELLAFMTQYRDTNYSTTANDKQNLIDEIFLQKRVEFWGEGINYFDYKRLNKPVTRAYEGSNFSPYAQFNTSTRPAWMNFVFVRNAYNGTIEEWNNPDPSDCYTIGAY